MPMMKGEFLIFPSPLVGEVGGGRDASASQENSVTSALIENPSAADAAGPHPNPPHKGEGFKRLNLPASATCLARRLRKEMTVAERRLWRALRSALPDRHWRKQVPFGPYIADFCSHRSKLIIELDGGQHAEHEDYDTARTRFLESEGYRVLRFWNNDVLNNTSGVLEMIAEAMLPSPPPCFATGPSFSQGRGQAAAP